MLGTTSENLRKRVQRGLTIRGVKQGNAWFVHRTDVEREVRAQTPISAVTQTSTGTALKRELALTHELLEAERRRADHLDALLAEERQASAELRHLLARVLAESENPDSDSPPIRVTRSC
jgi:hypothetical protein